MSNFKQFVFALPETEQEPIKLKLRTTWDQLKEGVRTITQPELRRAVHIGHTPDRITVQPLNADGEANPAYAAILNLAQKSDAHIAKFDGQKARARRNKRNQVIIDAMVAAGMTFEI